MPILDEQDARIVEEEKVIAVVPAVAALPTVDVDALLALKNGEDWEVEGAAGLEEVARAGVICILRKLQANCRAKRRKIPASVAQAFMLAFELLGRVVAYMSMVDRATPLN